MNLLIGQKLKMVIGTSVSDVIVSSLHKDRDEIKGSLEERDYSGRGIPFTMKGDQIEGSKSIGYDQWSKFSLHESLELAAEAARKNFLETNKKMRENVERQMKQLIEFRKKNYELLYLDNTEDWIENFKREYQW